MKTMIAAMALTLAVMPATANAGELGYTYIMPQDEAAMINSINTTANIEQGGATAANEADWRATQQDILQVWNEYYKRPSAYAYSGTRPTDPASRSLLTQRPGRSAPKVTGRVVPKPAVQAMPSGAGAGVNPAAMPGALQKPATSATSTTSTNPPASGLPVPVSSATPAASRPAASAVQPSLPAAPDNALANRDFALNPPPEIRPDGSAAILTGSANNTPPVNGARAGDMRLNLPPATTSGGGTGISASTGNSITPPPPGQPTSLINATPRPPSAAPLPAGPYQGAAPAVQDRSIAIGN